MAILMEEERREKAAALKQYRSSAFNAVNQLKAFKTQLAALKTTVNNDAVNFTVDDATDVQTVIDEIVAEIADI